MSEKLNSNEVQKLALEALNGIEEARTKLLEYTWAVLAPIVIKQLKNMNLTELFDDLQQLSAEWFYEQFDNYDPTASSYSTYFSNFFPFKIWKFVYKNNVIHVPERNIVATKQIEKMEVSGMNKEQIKTKLGLSEKDYSRAMYVARIISPVPLDAQVKSYEAEDKEVSKIEQIESKDYSSRPEEAYEEKELQELVINRLKSILTVEEYELLESLFGLNGKAKITQTEYAFINKLPKCKVAEIKKNAMAKLKNDKDINDYHDNF